ncbi:MAG: YbaN family protein [Spirochaetes bacterium]|nr:YbaN family protein [Spirochaetota bacterium]MBN2769162.1 YbaN family protein [Spirochaetota bacterium]
MRNLLLMTIGTLAVLLGLLGIILPGLPTTPFLLLSSFCFLKSSPKLYNKLHTNRITAPYIKPFTTYKAISLKGKFLSVISMWTVMFFSCFFFIDNNYIKFIIIICGIAVAIYILKYPTLTKEIIEKHKNQTYKL